MIGLHSRWMTMRWMILLACSCTLGACTPMEWRRGNEVATIDSDEYRKCRQYAFAEATRRMPLYDIYPHPIAGRDRFGRPFVYTPPWSHTDRVVEEHMRTVQCMVDLGFDLVPIEPRPGMAPAPAKQGAQTTP
jgi:hypothetical protein